MNFCRVVVIAELLLRDIVCNLRDYVTDYGLMLFVIDGSYRYRNVQVLTGNKSSTYIMHPQKRRIGGERKQENCLILS